MRYHIVYLMIFVLLASSGCARKQPAGTDHATSLKTEQGTGNGADLLSDDFFNDDPLAHESRYYDPLEPMNRVFLSLMISSTSGS